MCATVSDLYNVYNNNCSFLILLCLQPYCKRRSYRSSERGDLHTTTVLFTCNASSHKTDWITTDYCLLCLFKCSRIQYDEGSWSRIFGVSSFWEFFCNYIVVLCTHYGLCVRIVVYPFFHTRCCWFTWNVLDVFVNVHLCRVLNDILYMRA